MNWRDITKTEPDSNGSRMWGRLVQATTAARQKVADKYYEVREGGNGILLFCSHLLTSAQNQTMTLPITPILNEYWLSITSRPKGYCHRGYRPLPPSRHQPLRQVLIALHIQMPPVVLGALCIVLVASQSPFKTSTIPQAPINPHLRIPVG